MNGEIGNRSFMEHNEPLTDAEFQKCTKNESD